MALMSSISRGSLRAVAFMAPASLHQPPGKAVVRWPIGRGSEALTAGPAVPGDLLAELLPIVGELSEILDRDTLLPTIADKVRRIVDYRILDIFLPEPDGSLVPAHIEGYA